MFLITLKCHMKRYRKSLLTFDGLYYVNTDLKFSGYAAYDVQWIRIEQKWYYRHILFDLIYFFVKIGGLYVCFICIATSSDCFNSCYIRSSYSYIFSRFSA